MGTVLRSGLGLLAALAVVVAVACFGLGYKVGVSDVRAQDRRAADIRQTPIVTSAAQLDERLVGRRVLFEGLIATENPGTDYGSGAERRRYVIFRADRVTRGTPDANGSVPLSYTRLATGFPAVAIEGADGLLRVANTDYEYSAPSRNAIWADPDLRVYGFVAGDRVVVDGTVVRQGEGLALQATLLTSQASADYLAARADQRGRGLYILAGQIMAVAGALGLLVAGALGGTAALLARRARRAEAAPVAPRDRAVAR